jgi:hypothetical protein
VTLLPEAVRELQTLLAANHAKDTLISDADPNVIDPWPAK